MTDEKHHDSSQPQAPDPQPQQGKQQPSAQPGTPDQQPQQPYPQGQPQQPYPQGQPQQPYQGQPYQPGQPQQPQQPYPQGQPQPPPKKSKKGCLIGCLVALGLVVLVGVVAAIVLPRVLGNYLTRLGGEELARIIPGLIDNIDRPETTAPRSTAAPRETTTAARQTTTRATTAAGTQETAKEDAKGEDPEELLRFPGTVRTESTKFEYGNTFQHSAEYLGEADIDDVRTFYEAFLEDQGWGKNMSMKVNDEVMLLYERQSDNLKEAATITIAESKRHEGQLVIMLIYQSQKTE